MGLGHGKALRKVTKWLWRHVLPCHDHVLNGILGTIPRGIDQVHKVIHIRYLLNPEFGLLINDPLSKPSVYLVLPFCNGLGKPRDRKGLGPAKLRYVVNINA